MVFLEGEYNSLGISMKVALGSPADLHIYDSDGRHVGINYETNEIEVEIPYAYYSGLSVEIQFVTIPEPTTNGYMIALIGTDSGSYTLTTQLKLPEGTITQTQTDKISEGETHNYNIQSSNGVIHVTETTPPTTTFDVGTPQFSSDGNLYISSESALSLDATDTVGGSGLATTGYRIWNGSFDGGWLAYALPFRLIGLGDGAYSIDFNSTDNAGNVEPTNTLTVILDNTGPLITVSNPPAGWALQDGVTFTGSIVDPESGVASMCFSIREANGGEGIPIGFECLPVSNDPSTGEWGFSFDTLLVPDGYYVFYIEAEDTLGNGASTTVPYSIRNWAVLELLPASENNKARRTMPVKFTLRVAAAVDPLQQLL